MLTGEIGLGAGGVRLQLMGFLVNHKKAKKADRGFTLIEVAIGLMLLGLLLVSLAQLYKVQKVDKEIIASRNNLSVINSALDKFVTKTGRYPLPALHNIPAGGLDFGREFTGSPGSIPNCTIANTTLCRTPGYKDINPVDTVLDPVLIGDLPFATLGLPKKFALDASKNRFTYAVTESLTSAATFNEDAGVIKVIDSTGAYHSGTAIDQHYVVVSHGRNQRGAFALNGMMSVPCTGAGKDIDNCNNDATFNSNFEWTPPPDPEYVRKSSFVPGSAYFDDFLVFDKSIGGDTWNKISSGGTQRIFTRASTAQVRIGPGSGIPVAKLDVMGTTGKPGNVKALQVNTNRLCRFAGCPAAGAITGLAAPAYPPNVFTPSIIGGPINTANAQKSGGGIYCGNKALTGISNANEQCNYNTFPTGVSLTACAVAGTYPAGIDASGNLICVVP